MKKFLLIILFWCLGCFQFALCQQNIFNVPNADLTPKGRLFLETESQFRPWNPNAYWNGTQYSAVGVGHNTELNMTLFNVSTPAQNKVTLGTGFKTVVPIPKLKDKYPKYEYKFIVGSQILNSLQGEGVGNWTYEAVSFRVPKTKTRLTGGLSYGTQQVFGVDKLAFMGGVEHPVNKKLTLLTDWFSGNEHFAGFLTSGFSYEIKEDFIIVVGYTVPNSSQNGPSGINITFAKTF